MENDVRLIDYPIDFNSRYFKKEIKKIEEENKMIKKAIQPDYQKMFRRIDNLDSSKIFY